MILKLSGILTFERFQDRYLREDVFIDHIRLRHKLQESQLNGKVWVTFETHYLTGEVAYERKPSGRHGYSEEDLGQMQSLMDDPDPISTPLTIGEIDILSLLKRYASESITLWVSERSFSHEDFARMGYEHYELSKWDSCLMCWANALYLNNDEAELDRYVLSIATAVAASSPDPIQNVDTLQQRIEQILNQYSPQRKRLKVTLGSLSSHDLFRVGRFYLQKSIDDPGEDGTYASASIPFFTSAVALAPDEADYYYRLNQAIVYGGRIADFDIEYVVDLVSKAISLNPSNDEYRDARAKIYEALGERELAEADRNNAQKIRVERFRDGFMHAVEQNRTIL